MKKIYVTIMLFGCLGSGLHAYGEKEGESQPAAPDILSALREDAATNRIHQSIELFRLIMGEASTEQIRNCLRLGATVHTQQDGRGTTPLHTAARLGRSDLANLFLERGADVNLQDASGYTPLHLALKNYLGHISEPGIRERTRETVQALLDHQADPTMLDRWGLMPSDWVSWDKEFQAIMNEAIRAHRQRIEESTQ